MSSVQSKPSSSTVKDIGPLDPAEFTEYQTAFTNNGLAGLKKKVDEDKDKWSKVPVNIAVTGNSGAGKSTFINSFRGLKAGSDGAAEVGVVETTKVPTKYMHPNNNNIALWDLPGVGTPSFPQKTYLEDVGFAKFDYFLIITCGRFTENDMWLASEVRGHNKKFYLIRTKLDVDVDNEKYDKPKSRKDATVKKIRRDMISNIEKEGFTDKDLFLLNNRDPLDYDFPILTETMINAVPKMKQEAMTLTLTILTEELIEKKKKILFNRAMKVAMGSTAAGMIPGLSLAVDILIIKSEIEFYKKQFGLDDESLTHYAQRLKVTTEHLKAELNLKSYLFESSVRSIGSYLGTVIISEIAETITAFALPIIGSIIASTLSYGSTVAALRSIIEAFALDALAINKRMMQELCDTNHT